MRILTIAFLLLALAAVPASQAQTTRFEVRVEQVGQAFPILKSGVFNTPVGAEGPGPILPGGAYEFSFAGRPGLNVSFATMFVQSNDLFYAPNPSGIPLFDENGTPVTGDITDQVELWDAGTEVDETPGEGANQAPRQSGPNAGDDENGVIVEIPDGTPNDGFTYPNKADVIRVTLSNDGGMGFTLRIENVSTDQTLTTSTGSVAIPLAPGTFAVHPPTVNFFEVGAAASPGIEAIAEDGDASVSLGELGPITGFTVPLAPIAYAIHPITVNFFEPGVAASEGIERSAEDGDPSVLATELASVEAVRAFGVTNTPVGADGPGPIFPGGAYTFTFTAEPGDYLSFATMFVQSNDLFYAFQPQGLRLFPGGNPISGDVTDQLELWDAGTEVDEEPGIGLNQAPRQTGPDMGDDENGVIVEIPNGGMNDGFTYPTRDQVIRVTVTPVETTPFVVRIENVSTGETLPIPGGSVAVPMAPGTFAVHPPTVSFFENGGAASPGIEAIAEDGDASISASELRGAGTLQFGAFNTPVGAEGPGPLLPGNAYEFDLEAAPGDHLSFATMFVQSNDLFYAPNPTGIPLFDGNGDPVSGDITDQVELWDAGTEVDEEPGTGPNQAPRQSGPNAGEDENGVIVEVPNGGMNDGFSYPTRDQVIRVTLLAGTSTSNDDLAIDLPSHFQLHGNYPNPFNPTTEITYDLAEAGLVQVAVYDVLGRQVALLVNDVQTGGRHNVTWNALDSQGARVPSGVYLYRLQVGSQQQTRTMVLLK
ncbi:MAG: spondin domain-containing protein [Bacteroidota bacterium]